MADLFVYKRRNALYPADEASYEALKSVKQGETVKVSMKKPRNPKHHRLLWALLTKTIEAGANFPNPESLLFYIKVRLGHCDMVQYPDGSIHPNPRSVAFESMDQTSFNRFYDGAIQIIAADVLPGVTEEQLRAEIEEMMKGPWEAYQ